MNESNSKCDFCGNVLEHPSLSRYALVFGHYNNDHYGKIYTGINSNHYRQLFAICGACMEDEEKIKKDLIHRIETNFTLKDEWKDD